MIAIFTKFEVKCESRWLSTTGINGHLIRHSSAIIYSWKHEGDICMQCCLTKEVIIFVRFNIGSKKNLLLPTVLDYILI